ncbi:hypothetical protein ABT025_17455 [Streptomyces sp. NPDC002809]|uniref:hypothetical protein n=1 Tax=Streptomyces sp. NPDC002809 TaxID=3154433 RepID=UPI0033337F0F
MRRPHIRTSRRGPAFRAVLAVLSLVLAGSSVGAGAAADVPAPAAGTSVITVKTGGDRQGDSAVTPLAGVRLALYDSEDATAPVTGDWGRCESDADGDCSFTVPDTGSGGANEGARFWVGQPDGGVPDGWFTNPALRTGDGSGSGSVESAYRFRAPAPADGETYSSTRDFMIGTDWSASPYAASGGIWQQSRVNPRKPESCGLDVAVVLDMSASVGSALPQLKQATDKLADALTGTPSRMALFSFDRNSPSSGTANTPELMQVSTQSGADAFKKLYADWALSSGTNWDQGLNAVAHAEPVYDLTVVLTDGNPTRWSKPYTGDGSHTHFADVEGGVFSANAVKAQGTRVVAVGVGKGVEGISGLNLKAISGETAFDDEAPNPSTADYYQTTDFAAAGEALHEMALTHCDGSLSVIKQIVPSGTTGEDVTGAEPAGPGWQFDASTTETGVGGLPDTQTTTDDGTGGVVFTPSFPNTVPAADVTVAETQQPGHTLVTQDGDNAVCTDVGDGSPVDVANTGTGGAPGFTVEVPRLGAVSCVVYNRATAGADVTVHKRWTVDGTTYDHADRPDGLDADLALTGPAGVEASGPTGPAGAESSAQDWDVTREGYDAGDTTTIAETPTVPASCTLDGSRLVSANGADIDEALPYDAELAAGHNTFTVENRVNCKAGLTLVKHVVNGHGGTASPADWTLGATGPSTVSGPSGADEVTGAEVEPGTYTLSESDGPQGYEAGDWACEASRDVLPVTGGTVDVATGAAVTCTLTNTEKEPRPTPTPTPTKPTPPPGGGHGGGGHGDGGHGDGDGNLAETGGVIGWWPGLVAALLVAVGAGLTLRRRGRTAAHRGAAPR